MGNTGEPETKRRHFSSVSPTAVSAAKRHLVAPSSDDNKLDIKVLRFQNQKLFQQLEAQKVECCVLEDKYDKLRAHKEIFENIVMFSRKSWEQLVSELESCSISTTEPANVRQDSQVSQMFEGGASFPVQDDLLHRLLETGAAENSVDDGSSDCIMNGAQMTSKATKTILQNIISSINCKCHVSEDVVSALQVTEDDSRMQIQKSVGSSMMEVRSLIMAVTEPYLKHRTLASKLHNHRDINAKLKTEQKRLAGQLNTARSELEEINSRLASLKAQNEGSIGALILFSPLGNKQVGEKDGGKQKEIQDLESSLKELKDSASNRLEEIRGLHEERIDILMKLVNLQNVLVNVKSIFSSSTFLKLGERLDISKAEMDHFRLSLEKLQAEKDKFLWHEKEVIIKEDTADLSQKFSKFSESRIAELEQELQKLVHEYSRIEKILEEALTEPGRSAIIADFNVLVLSLPKEMGVMRNELSKFKESSSEIHCLRAQLQYLSGQLQQKVIELQYMSNNAACQLSEIGRLHSMIRDLRQSEEELKLIMEMYIRESTDSSDVVESRNMECKAWACFRTVESSLDEHILELRVKAAIEGEAISQQRLATTEAKIVDLREKLELSVRDVSESSETLKSKHEESETYLSEIESIGQAFEEMQKQNQSLLQQVAERDDYNIKLVMEGVREKQMQDILSSEIQTIDRKIQDANSLIDLYCLKFARSDEQLNYWSDQAPKLQEDGWKISLNWSNAQRRLSDLQTESQGLRQSMSDMQNQAEKSRLQVTELLIELEKERFNKKRTEEGLETMTMKSTFLRSRNDSLVLLQKLQDEVGEYRGILKCRICCDHQKEVVIAKCCHLFCSGCVKRTIESRHRKCPTCSASFGPNDVKPIYI